MRVNISEVVKKHGGKLTLGIGLLALAVYLYYKKK
jgi:hypothetical protein